MRLRRSILCVLAVLAVLWVLPATAQDLPRGKVIEEIRTAADPDQTYALYVPTTYKADRPAPILYAFDSRSDGKRVAERFRAGAEKYGYLVASSNRSASDIEDTAKNLQAMRAMWSDTHARFVIDDRRVYAAGFSGTVRFACSLALSAPGTIAGIIGAGAGFPFGVAPKKDNPFAFFGTVGDRDFNYYEVMDLDESMTALGLPHRMELFEGAHEWPPEALAARALGWMELQAMKQGTREKSPELVEALWADDLGRARAVESAGDLVEAHRLYAGIAADYAGLKTAEALAEVERKVKEIGASPAFQKERQARRERNTRDKEYIEQAPKAISSPTLSQALAELKIAQLKKQAESADKQENLAARRLLNTVLVQTSYYLPQMFTQRGEHDRAILVQSIAVEILPERSDVWCGLAASYARKGNRKKALEMLRKAAEHGWKNAAQLEAEPAFASLKKDKEFQEILGQMR